MEKMNGTSSSEVVGVNNIEELNKLTERVEEFKKILEGNAGNEKITQLSEYAKIAGLM